MADEWAEEKAQRMVEMQIRRRGIVDPAVLGAMEQVPRHRFVPVEHHHHAYADHPLPIGYGQTISQPYIVALMTELLRLEPEYRVLEIGTGCGYQAAVLAEIVDQVYSIEIIPELADSAARRLSDLGYTNVQVRNSDGYLGWPKHAPYQGVMVTAAAPEIPPPLIEQMADGGRMIVPVGGRLGFQDLWLLEKRGEQVHRTNYGGVLFVPLTRRGR
jgi:protein-L-isoaspartate(D-aspartate) O-methyltransferase